MKNLLKASLLAGLFFSTSVLAALGQDHIDWTRSTTQIDGFTYTCNGYYPGKPTYTTPSPDSDLAKCMSKAANAMFQHLPPKPTNRVADLGQGNKLAVTVTVTNLPTPSPVTESGYSFGYIVDEVSVRTTCAADAQGNWICNNGNPSTSRYTVGGTVGLGTKKVSKVCPKGYPNLSTNENNELLCYADAPPLDCSNLKGLSTNSLRDYFIADEGAYGIEKPSCVTKCGTDTQGNKRCSNCKVIAKSWINASTSGGKTMWRPLVGTLTGASCAATEQETPPPDKPTCWQSKNNLKMCQADPDEKCVVINSTQQCQAGCGFINGDFFCSEKTDDPLLPPKANPDKQLPEPDDNITTPEKPIDQLVKGDFKDVQRGVETRLNAVNTGIGNLENSVDTGNELMGSIKGTLEDSLAVQEGILSELEDMNEDGDGQCDPETEDCGPETSCDPMKQNCDGFATGPRSWWTKKYPEGLKSLFAEKQASFTSSEAFQAMQFSSDIPTGGGPPSWNFCVDVGSLGSFGCTELTPPPIVWTFIRICFLFGAAILCRRMLIGA